MASSDSISVALTGCVKWFNNSLSYGFITVITEGKYNNNDIFVHQSNLQTKKECFRTLFTGECVQFVLTNSTNDKHPLHAVNVSGYNGLPLHCEASSKPYNGSRDGSRDGSGDGGRDVDDDRNNRHSDDSRGRGRGGFRGGGRGGSSMRGDSSTSNYKKDMPLKLSNMSILSSNSFRPFKDDS